MTKILKTLPSLVVAAGLAIAGASSAAAQTTKSKVTGIGYSQSEAGASARAIRAWTRTTINEYGFTFADYNSARYKRMNCANIGEGSVGTNSVGVDGNINDSWSCTTTARPYGYGPASLRR